MKAVVFTLGCKVNSRESSAILNGLLQKGYEISDKLEYADLYIINIDDYFLSLGGVSSYPMTVVVDADGIITFRREGSMTYNELVAAINTAK